MKRQIPNYIRIEVGKNRSTTLYLETLWPCGKKGTYYRHAGAWGFDAKLINGELQITDIAVQGNHLKGNKITETTRADYIENNLPYVNKDFRIKPKSIKEELEYDFTADDIPF